jgi:long-chain acyl-CoA synthetase
MVLGDILSRNADVIPNKLAVVCRNTDKKCSYAQLNTRVNRLANGLIDIGLCRGDRLAILQHNCAEYVEAFFAAAKIGAPLVALDHRLVAREVLYILNDSGAKVLIVGAQYAGVIDSLRSELKSVDEFIYVGATHEQMMPYESLLASYPAAEPRAKAQEDDLATLYYTSGTTGVPKGVMMTHKNLWAAMINSERALPVLADDITLHTSPFSHIAAVWPLLAHCHTGGTNVILERFDPRLVLEAIEQEKVTTWNSVPTMIQRVLEYPDANHYDVSSLRWVGYGASPMPVEVLKKAIATFGSRFVQVYGSTETYLVTMLPKEDHVVYGPKNKVRRLISCGKPIGDCQVRIVDDQGRDVSPGEIGEIAVKGESITHGYWEQPDETARAIKDGWFLTGDLAHTDEDGYVYIAGRKKDLIITGGENVSPREIEDVIYKHPSVLEAAVIGVPDERWGEAVKAVVVLREKRTASAEDIIAFCKQNLARFKVPKSVEFLDALPKTATGKVKRAELKERFGPSSPG